MSSLIQESAALGGSIRSLCQQTAISRTCYYRSLHGRSLHGRSHCTAAPASAQSKPLQQNDLLRSQVHALAQECTSDGYRRITKALHRQGVVVNHKRVLRIMREDYLLCKKKKRFVHTTSSNHGFAVYPNVAADMDVTGPDQLWVSDLTYIRVGCGFVYLAAVLDACSRRCLGWSLGRRLDASLAVSALRMALRDRRPQVHHSDRGVQYASKEYTEILKAHGIQISMSRKGNPYDNAKAESFMKTLKYEQVYLSEYENVVDARAQIGHFVEDVYNQKRLHSSLGYMPPAEFEQKYYAEVKASRDKNQTITP